MIILGNPKLGYDKDDGEEEVTSKLHTRDIVSQRSIYVSKPKSIPIFSFT
jgi:hypothetical protein